MNGVTALKEYLKKKMIIAFEDSERFVAQRIADSNFIGSLDILDVGCGTGTVTRKIIELSGVQDYCLCGVDIKELNPVTSGLRCFQVDIENNRLPFGDGVFDIVFSHQLLEHLLSCFPVFPISFLSPGFSFRSRLVIF